jgi:hypothetical protein
MSMKQVDPLYTEALRRIIDGSFSEEPPNGDWGIDQETGKTRSRGRAVRALRKHIYEIRGQNLLPSMLKRMLSDCEVVGRKELASV